MIMADEEKVKFLTTLKAILGSVAIVMAMFGTPIPAGVQEALVGVAAGGFVLVQWLQDLVRGKK